MDETVKKRARESWWLFWVEGGREQEKSGTVVKVKNQGLDFLAKKNFRIFVKNDDGGANFLFLVGISISDEISFRVF